jgi:hypothetical protein
MSQAASLNAPPGAVAVYGGDRRFGQSQNCMTKSNRLPAPAAIARPCAARQRGGLDVEARREGTSGAANDDADALVGREARAAAFVSSINRIESIETRGRLNVS